MKRRDFSKLCCLSSIGLTFQAKSIHAQTFLTIEQAMTILWGDSLLVPVNMSLTKAQAKLIESASDTHVRHYELNLWKSESNGWFIVDQVIGKHENIDIAVGLDHKGRVLGIEVLTYRESYGDEVRHPKWRAQFHGKDAEKILRLDEDIKNISGATLSCRHITDGINRLTHTWQQVLRHH